MKSYRFAILAFAVLVSAAVHGQLFVPLGLEIETPREMIGCFFQPQMHVEGEILCVCTKQGLYSKDLSNNESEWQLVGFEGIPLQDYARSGNDILALRHSYYEPKVFFLLSHDGGKIYEDITPAFFKGNGNVFMSLEQHPADSSTLLTSSSLGYGIFLTTDFGQNWKKLASYKPNYMGYHPMNPEIIYESYGEHFDWKTDLHISYDGGLTWEDKSSFLLGNTEIFRMAFHPTDPNRWIAGGWWCVYTTCDNGQTWGKQFFHEKQTLDDYDYLAPWRYAEYDNENANIVYMAGSYTDYMKLMCSTDGGTTWNRPYLEPIKTTPDEFIFDMKQYRDKLLIYSQSDVYMVSKADLIEQTTSISEKSLTPNPSQRERGAIYDLSGRKVNSLNSQFSTFNSQLKKKGIYIQNGVKRVIK